MDRRNAISRITILSGAILVASTGVMSGCGFGAKKRTALTVKDIPLLDEIGETIIPTTATSEGAKATAIGAYMVDMVNNCYNKDQQKIFIDGLNFFDKTCEDKYKVGFLELSQAQKKQFLIQLDAQSKQPLAKGTANQQSLEYVGMLKELTINGYFTSKIGVTKARRYEAVPGRFDGCISYKKGDRPWGS